MSAHRWDQTRGVCVSLGRIAIGMLELEDLDGTIADGERALSLGPVVDPTLAMRAGPELERELKLLRAVRRFRAELEELRPVEEASS